MDGTLRKFEFREGTPPGYYVRHYEAWLDHAYPIHVDDVSPTVAHAGATFDALLDACGRLAVRRAEERDPALARTVEAINRYGLFVFEDYREVLREWQKRIWYQQCVLRGALRLAMRDAEQPRGWKRIKEAA